MSDIDNLLDATLDDIADLPEFLPYPPGAHQVRVSLSLKEINKHQAIEASFKAMQTLELEDPTNTTPLQAGAETSVAYMLDNEYGLGNFKKIATPLSAALGTTTVRDLIVACQEVECVIITSLRKDKNDSTKVYTNVVNLAVP